MDTYPGTAGVQTAALAVHEDPLRANNARRYTVRSNALPSGAVTATSRDVAVEIDTGATPLTYSATTWNTAQTVTMRAGEDHDAVTWTHDPSGADYGNVANVALVFTVNDDDTWAVVDTNLGTPGAQTGRWR